MTRPEKPAVLAQMETTLGALHTQVQRLDAEYAKPGGTASFKAAIKRQRDTTRSQGRKLLYKYKDLKNLTDMCFMTGCRAPITVTSYCTEHKDRITRKGT